MHNPRVTARSLPSTPRRVASLFTAATALLLLAAVAPGCSQHGARKIRVAQAEPDAAPVGASDVVAALAPTPAVGGVGWVEARAVDGNTAGDTGTQLALRELAVRVDAAGVGTAAFEVEHRFHNDGDARMEGTFRFTLPPGAVVTGLAMDVEGELMEGEFVEKNKARRTYEQIVDSMKDPALLEWEQGKTFKMRVFPIEPRADKRVVLRYLAPIGHDERGAPQIVHPLAAPAMRGKIGRVTVSVSGETRLDRRDVAPDERLVIPLSADWSGHQVLAQSADDGRYLAVRVSPDWSRVPAPTPGPERRQVVLLIDSSRSALEAWPLVRESTRRLMESLGPHDELAVLVGDLFVRDVGDGWGDASSARIAAIDRAIAAIEPDGASDLSRAHAAAGDLLMQARAASGGQARRQLIYIGDGAPTWGEIDDGTLAEQARAALGDAEMHALALGKSPRDAFLRRVTGAARGAVVDPMTGDQVEAFSRFVRQAHAVRRLERVEVSVPEGAEVVMPPGGTWFEGQAPVVYLRLPDATSTSATPDVVTVTGFVGTESIEQRIALDRPEVGYHLDQLWAAGRLDAGLDIVDREAKKAATVAMSRRYGVMSRETSLLVLESEEAYERFQIERANRRAQQVLDAQDPTVSGRDLESLGGDGTSLTPGDLQPGDPEIEIPAPHDARSVTALFPIGETKRARWDEARGRWTLRFLVDEGTPAGTYDVQIRIVHADGRVELTKATYTIDMVAPTVELVLQATDDPGTFRVLARQRLEREDAARERPEGVPTGDETATTLDAKRVRALMPDGQTLILRAGRAGAFERDWTPRDGAASLGAGSPVEVELSVTDRALNTRVQTVTVRVPQERGR